MTENEDPQSEQRPSPEQLQKTFDEKCQTAVSMLHDAELRTFHAGNEHYVSYEEQHLFQERLREARQQQKYAQFRIDNAQCAERLFKEKGRSGYLEYEIKELDAACQMISDIDVEGLVQI
jgi:hypothetical protein